MKSVTVPLTPQMIAALARLAEARAALQKDRGRSPGQVLEVNLRESPVQSAAPGKGRRSEEDPAPGREDTDKGALLEGLRNARSASVFTSRCKS